MVSYSRNSCHLHAASWLFLDVRIVSRIAVSPNCFLYLLRVKIVSMTGKDIFDVLHVIELGFQESAGAFVWLL